MIFTKKALKIGLFILTAFSISAYAANANSQIEKISNSKNETYNLKNSQIKTQKLNAENNEENNSLQVAPFKQNPDLKPFPGNAYGNLDNTFIEALQNFSFDIFNKCIQENEYKGNVFISPYSIAAAITLVYNGSAGNTKTEIENVLHFKNFNIEKLNANFLKFKNYFAAADPKVTIEIANSLWSRKGLDYKEKYVNFNKYYHDAEIKTLSDAKTINDWVSEKTHNKINKIVSDEAVSGAVMALINAVYFKAEWAIKFSEKATKDEDFESYGQKIKCKMMCDKDKYIYFENDQLQAIRLAYGDYKMNMYVFLPRPNIDFKEFAGNFNAKKFTEYISKLELCRGIIKLPKFKIEYEKELNGLLQKMGMKDAFDAAADFSKIFKPPVSPLKISQVIHKAFVDVNEEGTEAAAATAVLAIPGCAAERPEQLKNFEMIINRPFIFAIADNETKTILFMGAITNPSN